MGAAGETRQVVDDFPLVIVNNKDSERILKLVAMIVSLIARLLQSRRLEVWRLPKHRVVQIGS